MSDADRPPGDTTDEQFALALEICSHLGDALVSPTDTPVPTHFLPVWNRLRSALDGDGDLAGTSATLQMMRGAASDPGSPHYLGYVPNAALPLTRAVDAYVSIVNAVASGRVDGHAFVQAENAVADKLAELAGFPAESRGGAFTPGGTMANFCALAVARQRWRSRRRTTPSPVVLGSLLTHSSIRVGARLLDIPFVPVPINALGEIDLDALRVIAKRYGDRIVAIIANAGTTTAGSVDRLDEVGKVARTHGAWFHVDGAYGGAVLLSAKHRSILEGVSTADSFVVDPHKWLFCPYDSSLLLYRDATEVSALQVFVQSHESDAGYLDFGFRHTAVDATPIQLPFEQGDLALQLSRRARGVALWALVAGLGVDAIGKLIDNAITAIAHVHEYAIDRGVETPVAPRLSVLLFSKASWTTSHDWDTHWVEPAFEKGLFVSTDAWHERPVGRICLVHPSVSGADFEPLVDLIADAS